MKEKYDDEGNIVNQYNDDAMRHSNCLFLAEVYGGRYISVKDEFDIDNQCVETGEYFEGERGDSWDGDRFNPENYQYDRFNCGFATLNAPERKMGVWGHIAKNRRDLDYKIEKYKDSIVHFVRGNKTRLQMCVVRDYILRDPSKWTLKSPDFCVGNWKVPEQWMCIPRENIEVWNMQPHGKYELWTPTSGAYMTEEEEKRYLKQHILKIYKNSKK